MRSQKMAQSMFQKPLGKCRFCNSFVRVDCKFCCWACERSGGEVHMKSCIAIERQGQVDADRIYFDPSLGCSSTRPLFSQCGTCALLFRTCPHASGMCLVCGFVKIKSKKGPDRRRPKCFCEGLYEQLNCTGECRVCGVCHC